MATIDVQDLVIRYGRVTAVDGVRFTVAAGEVVGLLGGNGAGKSSTLRAIAGVNPPSAGRLVVAGHNLADRRGADRARQAVGYCPDVGGLLRQATVREHIGLALAFRHRTHLWPQAWELVDQFGLASVFDRVTAGFSHGMSRRLSVLLAALTADQALVLDEPFDGVDPLGVEVTLGTIQRARDAGVAVLVSTHLLELVTAGCDRVVVMSGGRVVDSAPAAQFAGGDGHARYAALLRDAA